MKFVLILSLACKVAGSTMITNETEKGTNFPSLEYSQETYPPIPDFNSILDLRGGVRQLLVLYPMLQDFHSHAIVSHLLKYAMFPVTLNVHQTPVQEEAETRTPNSAILILDKAMTVKQILNSTIRNHQTTYITICSSYSAVHDFLADFWQYRIISSFALLLSDDGKYEVFGFEPTPDGIFVKKVEKIRQVGVFNGHNTPVNVSVVPLPPAVIVDPSTEFSVGGVEGMLMVEVAKKFNLNARFAIPEDGEWWGWVHPPKGVVGELITGYASFGFGILAITDSRALVLDQLVGYNAKECVSWAVPKGAGPASAPWVSMLVTEFSTDTWAAMAGCSIFAILASLVIERHRLGATLFRIFASSIGSPVWLPVKAASRIFMLTWIWASFILAVAYNASMGSKLAVPPVNPDINTFQDLINSKLEVAGFYNSIRLMKAVKDPYIQILAQRSVVTTASVDEAFERMGKTRDLAYLRQESTFRYNAIRNPRAQEDIHLMVDCALSYYPAFNLNKWSPYYLGTSSTMRRLFDSGIIGLWGNTLMPELPPAPQTTKALSFSQLLGGFAVLWVGYGFSALAFTGELVVSGGLALGKWCKKKSEKKKAWQ